MTVFKVFILRILYYFFFLHYLLWRKFFERKGEPFKKILVIQDSGIGNLVLLTPLLKNLRDNFHESRIILLEGQNRASQLLKRGTVNEVLQYPRAPREKLRLAWRLRKEKIDLVLVSFLNSNYEMAIFSYLLGARIRAGYYSQKYAYGKGCGLLYNVRVKFPEITEERHEIDRHLDLLRDLKIPITDRKPEIYITEEDRIWAKDFLNRHGIKEEDKLVGIHPGAGERMRFKCWPVEKFIGLINELSREKGIKILAVGGKEEADIAESLERHLESGVIIFATGLTTLSQTAALIERCHLFISNDSGPMNIAFALGVPLIAIFGPTPWQQTAPFGEKCIIIRKNLPCMPCYRFKEVTCRHRKCLTSISVEE
ncbi:MAG: glycosyltransferase family 9 protein, partial [Caldiserica bacterium]|nr:glycosyltransferase family 9 protein [Caldisericota bacterium]